MHGSDKGGCRGQSPLSLHRTVRTWLNLFNVLDMLLYLMIKEV